MLAALARPVFRDFPLSRSSALAAAACAARRADATKSSPASLNVLHLARAVASGSLVIRLRCGARLSRTVSARASGNPVTRRQDGCAASSLCEDRLLGGLGRRLPPFRSWLPWRRLPRPSVPVAAEEPASFGAPSPAQAACSSRPVAPIAAAICGPLPSCRRGGRRSSVPARSSPRYRDEWPPAAPRRWVSSRRRRDGRPRPPLWSQTCSI